MLRISRTTKIFKGRPFGPNGTLELNFMPRASKSRIPSGDLQGQSLSYFMSKDPAGGFLRHHYCRKQGLAACSDWNQPVVCNAPFKESKQP